MTCESSPNPDHTAVRVALWRALHVQVDAPPHVLRDEVGLKLVAPDEGWRSRPDMHPEGTKGFRASIVARARFIEDLVETRAREGVRQYVLLGAGLDTFAQRRPEIASRLRIYEVDRPATQAWKQKRLVETRFPLPDWLRFVPVNFETSSGWDELMAAGFAPDRPSLITSTGVTMYLTREAIAATLRKLSALAPGSTLAMTYLLPMELAEPEERPSRELAERGARASGTPFLTFFTPEEISRLALDAGFRRAETVSAADLTGRYFAGRADGLRPFKSEEILVATAG